MPVPTPPLDTDPDGGFTYVIGDPQGRMDLLSKMLDKICESDTTPFAKNDKIVVMGNFLSPDGKNTKQLIEFLRKTKNKLGEQIVFLMGSSEHRLCKNKFNYYGSEQGHNIFKSYLREPYSTGNSRPASKKLDGETFIADIQWVADNTVKFVNLDNFFISSAGVKNCIETLERQTIGGLMFTDVSKLPKVDKHYNKKIVFGCYRSDKVLIRKHSILVNTDPYSNGHLSCVVLRDAKSEHIETIKVKEEPKEKEEEKAA